MDIRLQQSCDDIAVEKLLDVAFGEDRRNKAAYSFRNEAGPISDLSFVIDDDRDLIATLRFWPIKIDDVDALLLGPIAVKPELQGKGYGISLMKHGLQRAKEMGHTRVILVGDEAYYSKLGFNRKCVKQISMPGQADVSRLLGLELVTNSFYRVIGEVRSV